MEQRCMKGVAKTVVSKKLMAYLLIYKYVVKYLVLKRLQCKTIEVFVSGCGWGWGKSCWTESHQVWRSHSLSILRNNVSSGNYCNETCSLSCWINWMGQQTQYLRQDSRVLITGKSENSLFFFVIKILNKNVFRNERFFTPIISAVRTLVVSFSLLSQPVTLLFSHVRGNFRLVDLHTEIRARTSRREKDWR